MAKNMMTGQEVINTMNNAWSALVRQYQERPDRNIQFAINLLGKLCTKVECSYKESEKNAKREAKQITIDEWIAFFNE